jgi:glycosyltransferase involved in cell wall biosynthesis
MIRVSTIICVYNGATTIRAAIDSALAQDFAGQEIIVVNDGSTDDTAAVLAEYGDRIQVIEQINRGLAASRNAGAAIASGEYLAILDADDVWLPHHLERSVAALDVNRAAVLCCSDYLQVEDGKRLPMRQIEHVVSLEALIRKGWNGLPSAIVVRAVSFADCGGFCTEFRYLGFVDAYFWLRMRELGEFDCLHEVGAIYNAPAYHDLYAKYARRFPVYARLVLSRYGKSALPAIMVSKDRLAASLLTNALEQMDGKASSAAVRTLLCLAYFHPWYLVKNGNFRRLWRWRNFRRWRALLTSSVFGSEK